MSPPPRPLPELFRVPPTTRSNLPAWSDHWLAIVKPSADGSKLTPNCDACPREIELALAETEKDRSNAAIAKRAED
jgi:hypothetical protein